MARSEATWQSVSSGKAPLPKGGCQPQADWGIRFRRYACRYLESGSIAKPTSSAFRIGVTGRDMQA